MKRIFAKTPYKYYFLIKKKYFKMSNNSYLKYSECTHCSRLRGYVLGDSGLL